MTIVNGSAVTVSAGQTHSGDLVENFGTLNVLAGGTAIATSVIQSGTITEAAGAVTIGTALQTADFFPHALDQDSGLAISTFIEANGEQDVFAGGTALGTRIDNGGLQQISGGTGLNITVNNGGTELIGNAGAVVGLTLNTNGFASAASGTSLSNVIINGGGLELGSGGDEVNGGIVFQNPGGMLSIDGQNMPQNVISGFAGGDQIALFDVAFDALSGTVTLLANNTLQIVESGLVFDLQLDPTADFHGISFSASQNGTFGTIITGATIVVSSGQTSNGLTVFAGTTLDVASGGSVSDIVLSGGALLVEAGGNADRTIVDSGGVADIFGSDFGTTVNSGGVETVESGGSSVFTTVSAGALDVISAGGASFGTLLLGSGQQGTAIIQGAGTIGGKIGILGIAAQQLVYGTAVDTVINGGVLVLEIGGSLGQGAVSFAGSAGDLRIEGNLLPTNTISAFSPGDQIDLDAVAFDSNGSIGLSGHTLVLTEGGSAYNLNLDPSQRFFGEGFGFAPNGSGGTKIVVSAAALANQTQSVAATEYGIGNLIGNAGIEVDFGIERNGIVAFAGQNYVQSGGMTSGALIMAGADQFVEVGGTAVGGTVAGGSLEIYGTVSSTAITSNGRIDLFTGGITIGTIVSNGVELVIGTASGTVDFAGGFDFVYGSAAGTLVSGGIEFVEPGAVASGTTLNGGAQVVYGSALGETLDSGGTAYFLSGSFVSGVAVDNGLAVIIQVASDTTVASGSFDFVEPGGTAVNTVLSGGDEFVESAAVTIGTVIDNGAIQVDYGVTTGTVINSGGFQYVYPGGTASGTVVNKGGVDNIFVGFAVGTIDNSGGADFIYSGIASNTVVGAGGAEFVEFGGIAIGTLVSGVGATQDIVSGTASNTTLLSGGLQVVEVGRTASNTFAGIGGYEFVGSGGIAAGATISGGIVELTAGAATVGPIAFAASAGGLLKLDNSQHFSGTVAGFGLPGQIDLKDIAFNGNTTLGFQEAGNNLSGTLTVGDGTHTANLNLLGQYVAGQFHIASDGGAGTLVTDPPAAVTGHGGAMLAASPHT